MILEKLCRKLKKMMSKFDAFSKLTPVQKDAIASIRVDMEHIDAFRYYNETIEVPLTDRVKYCFSFSHNADMIEIYVDARGGVSFKVLKDYTSSSPDKEPSIRHEQNYTKSTYLSPLFQADKDLGVNMLCK